MSLDAHRAHRHGTRAVETQSLAVEMVVARVQPRRQPAKSKKARLKAEFVAPG